LLKLIQYNNSDNYSKEGLTPNEASEMIKKGHVNWIDVEVTEKEFVSEFVRLFNIHHLIEEDILNIDQLPKFEIFDRHLFFTTKMLNFNQEEGLIVKEHLSVVMCKGLLITFQEGMPGDDFEELRKKIMLGMGMIRKYGEDFLFYNILDAIVGHYVKIMEKLRAKIDHLESVSLADPTFDVMQSVMDIKKEVNLLRKYTIPMRDALSKMRVDADHFIKDSSVNYFQDIADQINYLITSFETSREMLRDLMDLHHSNQNNEMNRVMKTLTVVSAIFIPLTFLAGVYGMNFHYMPELDSRWGYPLTVGVMLTVATFLGYYMRRKKWF